MASRTFSHGIDSCSRSNDNSNSTDLCVLSTMSNCNDGNFERATSPLAVILVPDISNSSRLYNSLPASRSKHQSSIVFTFFRENLRKDFKRRIFSKPSKYMVILSQFSSSTNHLGSYRDGSSYSCNSFRFTQSEDLVNLIMKKKRCLLVLCMPSLFCFSN